MLMMIWHGFYHRLSMNDKWTMFCVNNCNKISGSGVSRKVNIVVIHYYWFGDWPLAPLMKAAMIPGALLGIH